MWGTQSSCEMNNTCIIWNMTKDQTFHGDVLIQLVWRNQFCQPSSHPYTPAQIYDSKQDFLYATRSIRRDPFFFFLPILNFPIWAFQSLAHILPEPHVLHVQALPCRRAPGQREERGLKSSPVPSHVCVCSEKGVRPSNLHKVVRLAEAMLS